MSWKIRWSFEPSVQVELDVNTQVNILSDKSPVSQEEELLEFSVSLYSVLRGVYHDFEPELLKVMSIAIKIKLCLVGPEAARVFPLVILNILKYCFSGPQLKRSQAEDRDPLKQLLRSVIAGLFAFVEDEG